MYTNIYVNKYISYDEKLKTSSIQLKVSCLSQSSVIHLDFDI